MSNQTLNERLANWMRGRNGADELGNTVVALSVILLLINVFAHTRWLSVIALLLAIYACWRMSSQAVARRQAENRAFLKALGPVANVVRNPQETVQEHHDFKHLTCPECGQKMRVPRGKGKMRVTCPKCHNKFEAQS